MWARGYFCGTVGQVDEDTIRPLMAKNLRKMAKSPQPVKKVSVKQG